MKISDIRIRKTYSANRLRAMVSVTVDSDFAVHDIKIIEGPDRLFVAMLSRKDENGVYRDICHPITTAARRQLEDAIIHAYQEYLATAELLPLEEEEPPKVDTPEAAQL